MVASQQKEVLGILELVGKKKADSLQRLFASVHIVPQEEVVCFGREATILKEPQQVCILTVNVTYRASVERRYC